jgi:hypothetical protein
VLELGFGVDWRGGVPHVDVPQARVLFGFIPACGSSLAQQCWRTDIAVGQRGRGLKGPREEKSYTGRIKDVAVAASRVQLALWNRVLKSSPRCKPNVQRSNSKRVNPCSAISSHDPTPQINLAAARLASIGTGLLEGRTELRWSNSVPERRARSGQAGLAEESTKIEGNRVCSCQYALHRLASWGRL